MNETIAAIITPHGKGGVGIIRISGSDSLRILKALAPSLQSGEITHQKLNLLPFIDPENARLADKGFAVFFHKPNSYTGEDCVELHCHGGEMNMRRMLSLVLKCGARLARNGEFTLRAFLNGKIDLTQAEAVLGMVEANSLAALNSAALTLEGALSKKVIEIREKLLDMLSIVEGEIDFPDDIDRSLPQLDTPGVEAIIQEIEDCLSVFDRQRILHSTIRVPIVGKPNVGKSSLFNALLGYPRSIICEEPGTTRDFISESLYFEDFFVSVIDTAGIRKTSSFVESEGVSRSERLIRESPLVIAVFDSSSEPDENDQYLFSILNRGKTIFVMNKIDLAAARLCVFLEANGFNALKVSALKGEGIAELRKCVAERIRSAFLPSETPFHINERQHDALKRLAASLKEAVRAVNQKEPAEIFAEELRRAVSIVNEITGGNISEEILERVFSNFCIGK